METAVTPVSIAVIHSALNLISIVVMLPFMRQLGSALPASP